MKASIIHVGAGSIQYENRLHEHVYDSDHRDSHYSDEPKARTVQLIEKDLCPFMKDSTSPELSIKAAVEEFARLVFWYHISSKSGETVISPGSFVQDKLGEAVAFKIGAYHETSNPGYKEDTVNHNQYFWVVYGEGRPSEVYASRPMLHPHHGNVLGRCVALVTSCGTVALLACEGDLPLFIRFWNHEIKMGRLPYYTLIS